jgi:hypothetical protein
MYAMALVVRFGLTADSSSLRISRSDTPASNGNPLAQQRCLQTSAAVHRKLCENPVEPV